MKRLLAVPFTLLAFYWAAAQSPYPDRIFADTAYSPFYYGVASGDPMQDRVILWTKVFTENSSITIPLQWQIATDSGFQQIANQGEVLASATHGFCVKVDAGNLQPGYHYFYRFVTADGKMSQTGKAETLPDDFVKHFKLAVVSCSSIWAGYFNAYRRIAERPDIDFVIHLGDYVYDYPDERQLNRMPKVPLKDPGNLSDWREMHTYYLLDPDLRAARQNKTWIAEWDNHDTNVNDTGRVEDAIQAFYEYLPIRMQDKNHPEKIYRNFPFGALADLTMIDMFSYRGKEEYAPGKKSVLGLAQDAWLKNQLATSTAQWHLLGNQEMMTDWLSEGAPKFIAKKRGNGRVFDPGNWNGFPEDRQRLYDFIDSNHIKNTVVLTGDIHMSFVMNMTGYPKDKTRYNRKTGEGAVGVEVTGPSISRVNMKEAGVPGFLLPAVRNFSMRLNPHHVWCQFSKHGYFTLDVTPEKCVTEFWYSTIKKVTDQEKFARGYTVRNGVSHWDKKPNKKRKHSTYP